MENGYTGLAKNFKARDNKLPIGNIVGEVINGFPDIKISILDGNIILTKDKLYCCNSVLSDALNIGDFLLLLHTANEQTWFIVDKVTKL